MKNLKVAILLTTYNGEKYLTEQMESLCNQTYRNWEIWASDDGSIDSTLKILDKYKIKLKNKLHILSGPKEGYAKNFWSLILNKKIIADYYAFCDQDDVWYLNKIEVAIDNLNKLDKNKTLLYCSRKRLVDKNLNTLGYSFKNTDNPTLKSALVFCIEGGNTMVFNNKIRELAMKIPIDYIKSSHDWLIYILVTSTNGIVYYDINYYIDYRQHEKNIMGDYNNIVGKIYRLKELLNNNYKEMIDSNLIILFYLKEYLPEESIKVMNDFIELRSGKIFNKINRMLSDYTFRPTILSNIVFKLAFILNKI